MATNSSTMPNKPFPFLKLPTELRLMVYSHLMNGDEIREVRIPGSSLDQQALMSGHIVCGPNPDLLLVNRQFSNEYVQLVFRHAMLVVFISQRPSLEPDSRIIAQNFLVNIKTVMILFNVVDHSIKDPHMENAVSVCSKLMGMIPSLGMITFYTRLTLNDSYKDAQGDPDEIIAKQCRDYQGTMAQIEAAASALKALYNDLHTEISHELLSPLYGLRDSEDDDTEGQSSLLSEDATSSWMIHRDATQKTVEWNGLNLEFYEVYD